MVWEACSASTSEALLSWVRQTSISCLRRTRAASNASSTTAVTDSAPKTMVSRLAGNLRQFSFM